MIKTEGLSRHFGDLIAVQDLSFELQAGQTLALIGPSGCGKTTSLKMLNRLIPPTAGRIWVNGQDVGQQSAVKLRRQMGYVIQDMGLFPHYTVAQNIGLVPQLLGWSTARIQQRTGLLLDQLGLPSGRFAQKYPHELSGGQQQRVGIARALAAEPPIVLMDEPFGALDPLTRQQIRRDFMELDALRATTIVMVTHDIEEAFEMGSLVCLLKQGRVQQFGPPEDLLFRPANDFVRAFVGEQSARLALNATRLRDVFGQLGRTQSPAAYVLELPARLPLLHAIYRLAKTGEQPSWGSSTLDGQQRWFTLDELFLIFQKTLRSWAN